MMIIINLVQVAEVEVGGWEAESPWLPHFNHCCYLSDLSVVMSGVDLMYQRRVGVP